MNIYTSDLFMDIDTSDEEHNYKNLNTKNDAKIINKTHKSLRTKSDSDINYRKILPILDSDLTEFEKEEIKLYNREDIYFGGNINVKIKKKN